MPGRTAIPAAPPPTESVEQINLFRWAEFQAGKYPELEYLFHIPNGGMRSKATAGRLRAEGVRPGVPDLFLPVPRGGLHGLFIEMKRERGNTTTKNQDRWIDFLMRQGYRAATCYGWEHAAKTILSYLEGRKDEI